jgi:hypothetical protein|tara:strand:- start:487 stop:756 length:270 start_codon:yes stop_codon:yes gene_type:complete
MGSKHNKKRFLIVKYSLNKQGQYDELVELSKKKCGPGKILQSGIVLDLINKEVIKCEVPGQPMGTDIPYESVYQHFHKAYGNVLEQFLK